MSGLDALHGEIDEHLQRIAGDGAPIRYVGFVGQLFGEYATARGKQLAGDKTPGFVRRTVQLHELWPEAKLMHIIRDPRDVCQTMLDWHYAHVGEVRWAFTVNLCAGDRSLTRSW